MLKKVIYISIFTMSSYLSFAQQLSGSANGPTWLKKMDRQPTTIFFSNNLEVENKGGHLQGIQSLIYDQNQYFVLSGSSSEYSYFSIIKTGEKNIVISHNKILDKPFKHAGGFQIHDNLMAIGVEDNDKKNTSKVFIFDIENPEKPPTKPLAIMDRMGTYKRATAGCVGITIINDKVLVIVGDWDTEHLDFYIIDENKLYNEGATLELEYSLNSKEFEKSDWINSDWLSYQNINFVLDSAKNIFLAAMATNQKGENVVDLFHVESEDLSTFNLRKIYSKTIESNHQTKFQWGAGISQNADHDIKILSCGEHIQSDNVIHIY